MNTNSFNYYFVTEIKLNKRISKKVLDITTCLIN